MAVCSTHGLKMEVGSHPSCSYSLASYTVDCCTSKIFSAYLIKLSIGIRMHATTKRTAAFTALCIVEIETDSLTALCQM
ncbi:hypothetical protein DOTSEDRAFT_71194 [Dothistroma septosporum NZE10]|uniref:Uncharacterized protein n=1 Tax=Dothistroma septosporum (strain NZE10 / CBS 128990) TaxID=675120 RepID=N1PPS7_DOTSN|nr:hypothetical protein DOTSEDRAFT_71194 [Dothistroma septosporum NZE10]